jgi:hypothetical protein
MMDHLPPGIVYLLMVAVVAACIGLAAILAWIADRWG